MRVRFATETEIKNWNSHILDNPDKGNLFQGREFAEQKQLAGWQARYLFIDAVAITIIEKSIPSMGKLWYIPKGPGVTTPPELKRLLSPLIQFAHRSGVFTIKIEPEILHIAPVTGLGLRKTRAIQPNYATVLVDISPDLETILKNLPQKGRHAIRRAERDGVSIQKVTTSDKNCDTMYKLLKETADAAHFGIRPKEYYRTFWKRYTDAGLGQLFFAEFEGKVIAGAFAIVFGTKSTYKDGASVRERTVYGASHLLQWHIIQWAKAHGALIHDLCGAPPIAESRNPSHPYYGIGLFKTSFNKEITEYVGAYEIPVQPKKISFLDPLFRKSYPPHLLQKTP